MNTWILLLIAAAVLVIVMVWRSSKMVKTTSGIPSTSIAPIEKAVVTSIPSAPGVSPSSGQVPTPPPPPRPPGVAAQVKSFLTPTGQLQHIPVVGNALATGAKTATMFPVNASLKLNSVVTSSLEHIPVVGKALALPSKTAGKVVSSVSHVFSSLF